MVVEIFNMTYSEDKPIAVVERDFSKKDEKFLMGNGFRRESAIPKNYEKTLPSVWTCARENLLIVVRDKT